MSLGFPFFENGFLTQLCCIWEATARKVGNVHRFADFRDTTYLDFVLSSSAIAPSISAIEHGGVGLAIWGGVRSTRELVGRNTNLGILLLISPLARVQGFHFCGDLGGPGRYDLRGGIDAVLTQLSVKDAKAVYDAISIANPGGLGTAPDQDVRDEPTVTLLEVMRLAADRDLIARQYANGFADVFDFGVPAFLAGFARFGNVEAGIVDSQLRWLAEYPDSLIARKNGLPVAEDVQRRAAGVQRLGGIGTPEGRRAGVELDRYLRSDGNKLNPGTTADLIAACLFVALRENKVAPSAPFRWPVEDWL